jgi:alanyl-tRNA synthetase
MAKEGFKASDWIQSTLEVCGGRGGGRPTNAQGQAPSCSDVQVLINAADAFSTEKLGTIV